MLFNTSTILHVFTEINVEKHEDDGGHVNKTDGVQVEPERGASAQVAVPCVRVQILKNTHIFIGRKLRINLTNFWYPYNI